MSGSKSRSVTGLPAVRQLPVLILLTCGLLGTAVRADIYRWDTGEVIPGTEGITPGPGVDLSHMELEYADLENRDLRGANLTDANLSAH